MEFHGQCIANYSSLLWGSTVGYPSDSLASCFSYFHAHCYRSKQGVFGVGQSNSIIQISVRPPLLPWLGRRHLGVGEWPGSCTRRYNCFRSESEQARLQRLCDVLLLASPVQSHIRRSTGNRMGWTVRCGRPPLLPSCRKLEFRLSALMDSDLAWVNDKNGRQSWRYADAFQRSIISEAIYHLPFYDYFILLLLLLLYYVTATMS